MTVKDRYLELYGRLPSDTGCRPSDRCPYCQAKTEDHVKGAVCADRCGWWEKY